MFPYTFPIDKMLLSLTLLSHTDSFVNALVAMLLRLVRGYQNCTREIKCKDKSCVLLTLEINKSTRYLWSNNAIRYLNRLDHGN